MNAKTVKGWTLGHCANCDTPLDPRGHPTLYCCEYCKSYAKDVRYFRACDRNGRAKDPDTREALNIRMAHLVVGGYSSKARRVAPAMRSAVLAANDGLCLACNKAPATEVDHIGGPGGERDNLQGLCDPCHNTKTTASTTSPMGPGEKAIRDAFLARVRRKEPLRASDDDVAWEKTWPPLFAATRRWCGPQEDPFEAGSFGDGSTGTVDDYEHGVYMQMLADRDD